MSKVSFIGLGVMGYPMAGHISKAGHDVTVFNRTTAKAEKWTKEYKGKFAKSPMEAAKDSGFQFVDGPVSGGQAGAENGALTVMIG